MPRRFASLDSVATAVRQHFGLEQHEQGLSRAAARHLETGRRALGPAAAAALAPLVARDVGHQRAVESTRYRRARGPQQLRMGQSPALKLRLRKS